MKVEVINTGTELLLGEILNTNFQYLSRQLNKLAWPYPRRYYQRSFMRNA